MKLIYAFTVSLCIMGAVFVQNMTRSIQKAQAEQKAFLESIR